MNKPNQVIPTTRQVIEQKLLAALDDENKVAILASKQDLEDMIVALDSYNWGHDRTIRCRELAKGLTQILREAFPTRPDRDDLPPQPGRRKG